MRHLALVAAAAFAVPTLAAADPVTGGITNVRVLVPLDGITPGVLGTATVRLTDPLDILFPITGGDLDPVTLAGTIEHEGSGFSLTSGSNVATVENLLIDTVAQLVFADLGLNGTSLGTDVPIFSFNFSQVTPPQLINIGAPQLQLNVTPEAAALVNSVFGEGTVTLPQRFGVTSTAPIIAEVPAPAALALFGLGALGVGATRRPRITPGAGCAA